MDDCIPNDIKNIIFYYKHKLEMSDIFKELKNFLVFKELSSEYSYVQVKKIINELNNYEYKLYIDYIELSKNIYSKILIFVFDKLDYARNLEVFFSQNDIDYLGVGNYTYNDIKGFFVYDQTISL